MMISMASLNMHAFSLVFFNKKLSVEVIRDIIMIFYSIGDCKETPSQRTLPLGSLEWLSF
jgi:hypothetical protein